ncbi:MAG: MATE family efflux transporter, partial [Eubacteriales bacterium]|nr:MATE family efflux transporter [Eubacteriales bacterium]
MMDSSSCLFNRVISHDLGVSIFDATSQNAYEIAQDTSRQILEEEMAAEDQAADKAFLRQLARLSLPIALQSLISTAVSYADVLILTTVDASALSAVSLAGQIIFVLTLLYAGISTGLTILGAQYWGRRDTATIGKVLGLALRLSMLSSVVFFLAMLLIPETLMRLFTPDKAVILFGIPYLRIVSAGCLAMGVSQMLLAVMKSMENTRESAWISISCLLTNILLNTLAVFVLFPGDPM